MNDLELATTVVGVILGFCAAIGIITFFVNEKKRKAGKKLSKKQKRELAK